MAETPEVLYEKANRRFALTYGNVSMKPSTTLPTILAMPPVEMSAALRAVVCLNCVWAKATIWVNTTDKPKQNNTQFKCSSQYLDFLNILMWMALDLRCFASCTFSDMVSMFLVVVCSATLGSVGKMSIPASDACSVMADVITRDPLQPYSVKK